MCTNSGRRGPDGSTIPESAVMSTDETTPQPTAARSLGPFERLERDEDADEYIVFDQTAHAEWMDKWVRPCPDGNPQRLRRALGFRERNVGELELRVALGGGDEHGVCRVLLDERDDEVFVRIFICYDEDAEWVPLKQRAYSDCPVRVWLDKPLGDRAVIDVDSDEELPLFIPTHRNGVPDPQHGYHPSNRRRRSDEEA